MLLKCLCISSGASGTFLFRPSTDPHVCFVFFFHFSVNVFLPPSAVLQRTHLCPERERAPSRRPVLELPRRGLAPPIPQPSPPPVCVFVRAWVHRVSFSITRSRLWLWTVSSLVNSNPPPPSISLVFCVTTVSLPTQLRYVQRMSLIRITVNLNIFNWTRKHEERYDIIIITTTTTTALLPFGQSVGNDPSPPPTRCRCWRRTSSPDERLHFLIEE